MIRIGFVLCNVLAATVAQTFICPWVLNMDCSRFLKNYICGSDQVTYENRCDFSKSHCSNKNLHVIAEGTCASFGQPNTTGTTHHTLPTTTYKPVIPGGDVLRDFFCLELSHEDCRNNTEKVCGTDNFTYGNFCEFEKARCTHNHLNVSHFGDC